MQACKLGVRAGVEASEVAAPSYPPPMVLYCVVVAGNQIALLHCHDGRCILVITLIVPQQKIGSLLQEQAAVAPPYPPVTV